MRIRWIIYTGAACALACQDEVPGSSDCQISYELLGASEADRVDLLIQPNSSVVKRIVRDDGDEDTAAIWYRFDDTEGSSALLHELDDDNDGAVDALMERTDVVEGLIDLYQVDAIADDGLVDSLQVSVPLETGGHFGGWRPARMFFTVPCGPIHDLATTESDGLVTVAVDVGRDGLQDIDMRLQFDGDRVQSWSVDNDFDGQVDFRGVATYREDGRVESVEWRDAFFTLVAVNAFTYNAAGELIGSVEDMNGDGNPENTIAYASACWEASDEAQ